MGGAKDTEQPRVSGSTESQTIPDRWIEFEESPVARIEGGIVGRSCVPYFSLRLSGTVCLLTPRP